MARKSSLLYLSVVLASVIAHLCWCAHHVNYHDYILENEKFCNFLHKKHTHELRNSTAAIVGSSHMFDRWNVNVDRFCKFSFKTARGEGLFAVVHRMFFRRNGTHCVDYVRFKRSDGHYTAKMCGTIDRDASTYNYLGAIMETSTNDMDPQVYAQKYDKFAEYDISKRTSGVEFETEIFISKEKMPNGQLDLSIVYTPFKNCNHVSDHEQYKSVGNNTCIRKEYICDRIHNCPLHSMWSDETNCPFANMTSREDTSTEVTVGAVTTVILCFLIFVMCLWICKRSKKLCWSSDCAGPNTCSRPSSLPQDVDLTTSRAVPTAPMLEVAVSSPVADKDLPPSYDSLFPEQSNPARS